jgi:hypothetical protein
MTWVRCWCDDKTKKWFCEVEAFVTQPEIINELYVILPNGYKIDLKCDENTEKVWLLGKMAKLIVKNDQYVVLEVWL